MKCVGVGQNRVVIAMYAPGEGDSEPYRIAARDVLCAPDFDAKTTPGARYRLTSESSAFNFTVDSDRRMYFVVTTPECSERAAFAVIHELVPKFKAEFGSATCMSAGSLNLKAQKLLKEVLENEDQLTKIHAEMKHVKSVMLENLDLMLENVDKAADIEASSRKLSDLASKFETKATTLKRRETCSKYKTSACCVLLVGIIVTIVVLSAIHTVQ